MLEWIQDWKRVILYSKSGALRTGWRALLFTGYLEAYVALLLVAGLGLLVLFTTLFQRRPSAQEAFLWFILLQGALALPTIRIARRMFQHHEQRPFASLGLLLNWHSLKQFAAGLMLGTIVAGIGFLYLYWSGMIRLSWNLISWTSALGISVVGLLAWLGVAVWEELYFRGYLLQTLIQGTGLYVAVVLVTAIFGLAHVATYGITPLILTDVALLGLVLALFYLRTKSLWGPIGLHFANNFLLAHVLSVPMNTVLRGFPLVKFNDQPVQFEIPRLFFQTEMSRGASLTSWETLVISLLGYLVVLFIILKLPWFRVDHQMEAFWQQYIHPAQPWARLRTWWKQRSANQSD